MSEVWDCAKKVWAFMSSGTASWHARSLQAVLYKRQLIALVSDLCHLWHSTASLALVSSGGSADRKALPMAVIFGSRARFIANHPRHGCAAPSLTPLGRTKDKGLGPSLRDCHHTRWHALVPTRCTPASVTVADDEMKVRKLPAGLRCHPAGTGTGNWQLRASLPPCSASQIPVTRFPRSSHCPMMIA